MPGFELFGNEERKEVNDVLDSGIMMRYGFDANRGGHWKSKELEKLISDKFQVEHVKLCSSGTNALISALASIGVGEGTEVILPTFTFVASFEAILLLGAVPVFVDVDETLTLDAEQVKKKINHRTKAIMVVHMCGAMADMDSLMDLAAENNIFVIEDACQSIGGKYKDKYLGTIGHIGCFSFDFVKTITCGEGGAVITNDKEVSLKVDAFTDHGHDHIGSDRGAEKNLFIGLNFRISELQSAVGVAQFRKLDDILSIQRKHKEIIKIELQKIKKLEFRHIPSLEGDNASFISFFLPSEELTRKIHSELLKQGVDSIFYWYDNNWHYVRKWQHFKKLKSLYPLSSFVKDNFSRDFNFPKSDSIISRTLSGLIKLSWREKEVIDRAKKMASIINKYL